MLIMNAEWKNKNEIQHFLNWKSVFIISPLCLSMISINLKQLALLLLIKRFDVFDR